MTYLLGVFTGLMIACFAVWIGALIGQGPLDVTDNHITGARSGFRILIDHGTGCQYLRTTSGGVTPRLDGHGKPMCEVTK